jgi:hypothetical protein
MIFLLWLVSIFLDSLFHSPELLFPGRWVFYGVTDSSRSIQHGCLYLHVAAAAAQIAREISPYLLWRRSRILFQKAFRAQNEPRRAIGALKSIVVNKCLLDGMQLAVLSQAFNGENLLSFSQRRQQQTRARRPAVQKHRASAAHAYSTTFARAEEFELGAQHFQQSVMGVNRFLLFYAIHFKLDDLLHDLLNDFVLA